MLDVGWTYSFNACGRLADASEPAAYNGNGMLYFGVRLRQLNQPYIDTRHFWTLRSILRFRIHEIFCRNRTESTGTACTKGTLQARQQGALTYVA